MGLFSGCLMLSDIDETLLSHGRPIPRRNIDAIKRFEEEGGKFAVASGRTLTACRPVWKESGSNTCLVCANGTVLYDCVEDRVIYSIHIAGECKDSILSAAERFPYGMIVDGERSSYVFRETGETRKLAKRLKYGLNPAGRGELMNIEWSKAVFVTEGIADSDRLTEYFRSVRLNGVKIVKSDVNYVELIPAEADKAVGALKLKSLLNAEVLFAIGDFENDLKMLKAADVSATVEGADDRIKRETDYVCCGAEDGAVAEFINILERDRKWSSLITKN